jgi:glycosyltransferase involved in cell wall biosynthesis
MGILRSYKPDLVHHVTPKPVVYGSIAARLAGIPRVVNAISGLGGVFSAGERTGWLHRLVRTGHRIAHAGGRTIVIFQNPDDRAALVSSGAVPMSRTRLIPGSGVDPLQWTPGTSPTSDPIVTVACRMLFDKGVGDAVAACDLLRGAGTPVELFLAGGVDDGNPRAIPEATLRAWHQDKRAHWLGKVSDMPSQWQRSRIACLPSYYGEGIPKALIEAASCGLPIVTCDVPGCREIVRHGDNGLLVPPRDPQALAAALARLLNDAELCARMGRRGRERVIAEFSLDRVVRQHMDIYRELLGSRWPGGPVP